MPNCWHECLPFGTRAEGEAFLRKAPLVFLGRVHWKRVRTVPPTVLDLSDWPDFFWY